MKYVVIIRSLFMEMAGVYGPFETSTEAQRWIEAEVETEKCLAEVWDITAPIHEAAQ